MAYGQNALSCDTLSHYFYHISNFVWHSQKKEKKKKGKRKRQRGGGHLPSNLKSQTTFQPLSSKDSTSWQVTYNASHG